MTERERERRVDAINESLLHHDRALALLDDQANTPDTRLDRERIELEMDRLRREREELTGPEFTPEMARAYINQMWDIVADLQKLMKRIVWWLIVLSVGVAIVLAIEIVLILEITRRV